MKRRGFFALIVSALASRFTQEPIYRLSDKGAGISIRFVRQFDLQQAQAITLEDVLAYQLAMSARLKHLGIST